MGKIPNIDIGSKIQKIKSKIPNIDIGAKIGKIESKIPNIDIGAKIGKIKSKIPNIDIGAKINKIKSKIPNIDIGAKVGKSNPRFPILILAKSRENLAKNPRKEGKEGGIKEDPKNLENLADGINLFCLLKNGPLFNKSCDHENQILLRMFL